MAKNERIAPTRPANCYESNAASAIRYGAVRRTATLQRVLYRKLSSAIVNLMFENKQQQFQIIIMTDIIPKSNLFMLKRRNVIITHWIGHTTKRMYKTSRNGDSKYQFISFTKLFNSQPPNGVFELSAPDWLIVLFVKDKDE